ncbi:hypothetical protein FACS189491_11200 [Spirochaetia bacterium]|nr:hypothetical protein FACS189491_11200 [Spirochaetia bacterium]
MKDLEKYGDVFIKTFGVKAEEVESLTYNTNPGWDSVGHMELMAVLENTFSIELEMDDIIDFSSYQKGMEILKKYGVSFE